jgi:hypothetical protein
VPSSVGAPIVDAGVDLSLDVTPAPSIANEVPTLQSGDVAAVQTINAQGFLLEQAGLARMIAVNDMPPQQIDFCCGCVMLASTIQRDRPKSHGHHPTPDAWQSGRRRTNQRWRS